MATPYSYSGATLNAEPSRTLLQKLLEEINGAPIPTVLRNRSSSVTTQPIRTRPVVWIGGAPIAQDARRKLRAADEARMRHGTSNTTDGAAGNGKPIVRVNSSHSHRHSLSSIEDMRATHNESPPDPVARPHDYLQFMTARDEESSGTQPAADRLRLQTSSLDLPPAASDSNIARPLSPLMFSDVDFETGSSHSGNSVSPTEAPTSATTVTGEHPRTPSDAGSTHSGKRAFSFFPESETSPKRIRTMTLPELHSHAHSHRRARSHATSGGDGEDATFLIRDELFTERVTTPRGSIHTQLPEVSSFRPGIATPQGQPTVRAAPRVPPPSRNTSASPGPPDTPPWMRPMHLVDTDNMSIYKRVHGNNPRYSLCLYCFSQHGDFCKVLTYGYETCGRHEVLKSHYWESGVWPEESDEDD